MAERRSRRALRFASALLGGVLGVSATQASAHELGVARLVVERRVDGFVLEAKLPADFESADPLAPERCALADRATGHPRPSVRIEHWRYACEPDALQADATLVLPWALEGAFVQTRTAGELGSGVFVSEVSGRIVVALANAGQASALQTVARFARLGIEHILAGWDHLAFLVALCLIAARRRLVELVTAFTLGHSVTLALAALGLVQIPALPVEACIALSIVFVAREASLPDRNLRHGAGLVFAFGLLHGLGFASALSASGIVRSELLVGLLGFNVGVEIGQLLFVLALALLLAALRRVEARPWLEPALAFGIGTLGVYWTLERVAGFSP